MIIKRFEATTTTKAFELVKKALGENAVIIANKTLDKGMPSQRVEIMAAMDYDQNDDSLAEMIPKTTATTVDTSAPYSYATVRKTTPNRRQQTKPQPRLESQQLRQDFNRILKQNGVRMPVQTTTSGQASTPANKPNPHQVKQWRDQLIEQITTAPLHFNGQGGPLVIALIGPTGVGKTTTAAKIAAWYHLHEGKRVTLLSMDCYRIGATDQLRSYARIMRLPCEVAIRKQDLTQAVARHQDSDLIIIDTAGKSPYDNNHIEELNDWFTHMDELHPFLVVSATTKKEDLQQIVKSYDRLAPHSIILTKLDETRTYATLCQQIAKAQLPVGYLTMGQRVPEDFLVADKPFLDSFFKKGWSAVQQKIN